MFLHMAQGRRIGRGGPSITVSFSTVSHKPPLNGDGKRCFRLEHGLSEYCGCCHGGGGVAADGVGVHLLLKSG